MINWRVYGDKTVACLLNQEELPGFFRKEISVGPGETAIVIRDGEIEAAYTQSRIRTAGLMDRILKFFKAQSRVDVLFLSASPFSFSFHVSAIAGDDEKVTCECNLSLRTDPENPDGIMGFLAGKKALAAADVYQKIQHEIITKGFSDLVQKNQSHDILATATLSHRIESSIQTSLKTTLSTWGLVFESFSMVWGQTEEIKTRIAVKEAKRIDQVKEFENRRRQMELARELAISKTRIQSLQEIKQLEATGQKELKEYYLEAVLGRNRMRDEARVGTAEIDASIRLIQAEAEHKEDLLRIETRKADEMTSLDVEDRRWRIKQEAKAGDLELEDKEMWGMVNMQIKMATEKHDRIMAARRQEIQADFNKTQARLGL